MVSEILKIKAFRVFHNFYEFLHIWLAMSTTFLFSANSFGVGENSSFSFSSFTEVCDFYNIIGRSSHRRYYIKQLLLKLLQNSQETPVSESL